MPSMYPCPKCGEYHYHKSHSRNFYERARKIILNQRVYRCHRCGYRAWEKRIRISHEKLSLKKILIYIVIIIIASFLGMIFKSLFI